MFSHAVTEIGSTTPQLLAEVGGMLLALGIAAFIAARLKFSVVPVFLLISLLLDWGVVGAVALGGITYVSSSGIAAQLTKEMGFMRSEVLKRASGILVFEDLALAPYPPLLTSLVPGVSAFSGLISVAAALVITGLILTVAARRCWLRVWPT